jgi:hypothetical protein
MRQRRGDRLMKRQIIVVSALLVMMGIGQLRADTKRIIGVITKVDRSGMPTLQVDSKGQETRRIHTDASTLYRKWFDDKRWRDPMASSANLVEGRCVEIETKSDDPSVARRIRINEDRAGSLYDPCRKRR